MYTSILILKIVFQLFVKDKLIKSTVPKVNILFRQMSDIGYILTDIDIFERFTAFHNYRDN